MSGHPSIVTASERAHDQEAVKRLWDISERLTGLTYDFARRPAS